MYYIVSAGVESECAILCCNGLFDWESYEVPCEAPATTDYELFGHLPLSRYVGLCQHEGLSGNLFEFYDAHSDKTENYCVTTSGMPIYQETRQYGYKTDFLYVDVFSLDFSDELFYLPVDCDCDAE